jgi:hypothetical protein
LTRKEMSMMTSSYKSIRQSAKPALPYGVIIPVVHAQDAGCRFEVALESVKTLSAAPFC